MPRATLIRELGRVGGQIAALPDLVAGPALQLCHDLKRKTTVRRHFGAEAKAGGEADKLAIFLLYQPAALPASVRMTCQDLAAQGYAVMVVANGGLQEQARLLLLPHIWQLIERPNFGYDFGGLREGIMQIAEQGLVPRDVLLLNDSIWLIGHESDLISRLEAQPCAGLIRNRKARDEQNPAHPGFVESYVLHLDAKVLKAPAHLRFWQRLRLSNLKRRIIQRGEKGFSRAMGAAGIGPVALADRVGFLKLINGLGAEELRKTLLYAAYIDPVRQAENARLLAREAEGEWRADVQRHIAATTAAIRFNASFIYPVVQHMGLHFLKKNRDPIFVAMRAAYLAAVAAGDLPAPKAEILAEIRLHDSVGKSGAGKGGAHG